METIAMETVAMETVPWRQHHGDSIMETGPLRQHYGDTALGTMPWRQRQGDPSVLLTSDSYQTDKLPRNKHVSKNVVEKVIKEDIQH